MINKIKELRLAHGWSMAQLGSMLNPPVNASQINKLEKGQRKLTSEWMIRLASALGCEPQDLINQPITLIGHIGEGGRIYNSENSEPGKILDQVERPPLTGRNLVALRVQGESMYPRYDDGDLIYFRMDESFIETECLQRECVVKTKDGTIYLKKLHKGQKPDRFILRSHNNPDMENVEIEWASPVSWRRPA